jgi:hypothetical protein
MATLAAQQVVRAGITPAYVAAAGGGDDFVNTGVEIIHIKNGDASPHTITIVTPNLVDGDLAVTDRAVVVPAGGEKMIGPFPTGTYNDGEGKVSLTYDAVTSVTIAIIDPV